MPSNLLEASPDIALNLRRASIQDDLKLVNNFDIVISQINKGFFHGNNYRHSVLLIYGSVIIICTRISVVLAENAVDLILWLLNL